MKVKWTSTHQFRWVEYTSLENGVYGIYYVLQQKHISFKNAIRWIEILDNRGRRIQIL